MLKRINHDIRPGGDPVADGNALATVHERVVADIAVVTDRDATRSEKPRLPVDHSATSHIDPV